MAWEVIEVIKELEIVIIIEAAALQHEIFCEFRKDSLAMDIAQYIIEYFLWLSHMA